VQKGKEFVTFAIRVYDVVRREGVKFQDRGSKIERNIAKHQICHTLPERSLRRHKFVVPKDFCHDQKGLTICHMGQIV
jgi:hypothetical protein